jgi:hypothetical protein
MNPQDIIREAEEYASEWIEHADNPSAVVAGVLANKIVTLNEYIDYLERRLKNDSHSTWVN